MSTRKSISKRTHGDRSAVALEKLDDWGFSAQVLQRLGGFAVVWGIFEWKLEEALWALTAEKVEGVRPSTDKQPISAQIGLLTQHSARLSTDAQAVVANAADAAMNLMEYRHAIMHGAMIPSALDAPLFIRNPRWRGVKRSRPTHDAHVDESLLNLAIDTAWILCRLVSSLIDLATESSIESRVQQLRQDVQRAKRQANELRHLTDLVNSEKY